MHSRSIQSLLSSKLRMGYLDLEKVQRSQPHQNLSVCLSWGGGWQWRYLVLLVVGGKTSQHSICHIAPNTRFNVYIRQKIRIIYNIYSYKCKLYWCEHELANFLPF